MEKNIIYADNAATTKLDNDAYEAMRKFLLEEYANPSANYSFSRTSAKAIKQARLMIANCIGADENEIYFTSGGTEGDNWILKTIAHGSKMEGHIITTEIEHHAILETCEWLKKDGITVTYLPVNNVGLVTAQDLENAIRPDTILVSIMFANNEVGTIQNIYELVKIAHKHKIPFHTDAAQAVGHIPIDVKELGLDFLTVSAHKFNGYKGTGFAYISDNIKFNPFISGGAQEKHLRAGTENVAGIVAMGVALEKNCKNMTEYTIKIKKVVEALMHTFENKMLDYIRNGAENALPGIVSISFKNVEGETIMHRLDLKGICVSTGAACNSKETVASHVLKAMKVSDEYINGTIRVSFGRENTVNEACFIGESISEILLGWRWEDNET